MTIESLLGVVPPPEAPDDGYGGPWDLIEAGLRTPLPQDYKDFVRLYGSGYFMEYLGIHVPHSKNINVRLFTQNEFVARSLRRYPDFGLPYPLWPDPAGLILFGGTDGGDELFWLPKGRAPNAWGVFVMGRQFNTEDEEFEEFDCDLTDFLAGLAAGQIRPKAFPDLLPCERLFQSSGPA